VPHRRADVVAQALAVLDAHGLADLTMRRLAADLGVRPSALYHHVATKQELLGAVADALLARRDPPVPTGEWAADVRATCTWLRESVLAYRDGAELVATAASFGLGAQAAYDALVAALRPAGLPAPVDRTAARTLWHFVLGHALDEQTHLQADSAGALPTSGEQPAPGPGADFDLGLALVVDGIGMRTGAVAGSRRVHAPGP